MNTILVTGCAGYIGGTFSYWALQNDYKVIGVDNFINSKPETVEAIQNDFPESFIFLEENLANSNHKLNSILADKNIQAVVHFAGLKAVGESEQKPLMYWENNIMSTINLLKTMDKHNIKKLVFSSSATVYGDSQFQPISENYEIKSMSTYGSTKIAAEQLLNDCARQGSMDVICLRYFNPVGSHKEMKIFDDPLDMPNNLMPRIIRVAMNLDKEIKIYGNDYPTRDGTGERDYIHIVDLIDGHFKAIDFLKDFKGFEVVNLGTGKSITVKEIISCFQEVNGIKIPHKYVDRRPGDVAKCYANPKKASDVLGWSSKKNLNEMCLDAWRAILKNKK